MGGNKFAVRIAVVVAVVGTALALTTAPAQAAQPVISKTVAATGHGVVQPNAGWLGSCYLTRGSTFAGGWCDGNGPDWSYSGTVRCSNGYWYEGINRWAGDRRGSYAECPSGTQSNLGGVDIFYRGVYQYSNLI